MKKLIIHDIDPIEFAKFFPNALAETTILSTAQSPKACLGCFGCWIKTPGICVIKDGYENFGAQLAQVDELIIISRCFYGTYSPYVKNILDRGISFLLPYFKKKHGIIRHQQRYKKCPKFTVHFYGDISQQEKETAKSMVLVNASDNGAENHSVSFHDDWKNIQEIK